MAFLRTHRRWLIGTFVLLAVACVLWFAGPLIVLGESRPLEGALARGMSCLALAILWLGAELGRLVWIKRRQASLVHALSSTGLDEASTKQEAQLLAQRFREALSTLGQGQRGRGGAGLLYRLPWYMFIGAPGSGKTTALVNSGLRFPLAAPGATAASIAGVGGTRHCDWWFTTEAVLIDTAGRYTTQDSHAKVDESAWHTFLQLLKKHRPRQPINGVFVTLSVGDLLASSAAERLQYAQTVRQRLDDIQSQLGMRFPVYLLVTKCDLIAGFDEFFSSLDAEQRAQVWGVTLDLDIATRTPEPAQPGFDAALPILVERLNQRLMERLQEERDLERRALMYPFPQQFASMGPMVSEFLASVFGETAYGTPAMLRGVYFTSGTQQGAPIDRLLGALTQSMALRRGLSGYARLPGAGKSYFIHRLLTSVVFQEAGLAGFSAVREARMKRLNWALTAAAMALGAGLIAAWTISYQANREGLSRAGDAAGRAHAALIAVEPADADNLRPLMAALDELRRIPDAVHEPADEPRWGMTWGLYQGSSVKDQVDERYRLALQQGLMPRIARQFESVMAAPSTPASEVYDALKTYLMMHDERRMDRAAFVRIVTQHWFARYGSSLPSSATTHLQALVDGGDLLVARFHPFNAALVARTREGLTRTSITDRAYAAVSGAPVEGVDGLRLSEVLGPAGLGLFERASGTPLTEPIPPYFTRQGYRGVVKPRIEQVVSAMVAEEAWVLGARGSGSGSAQASQVALEVQRRYLMDFQAAWDKLLADIRLRPVEGINALLRVTQTLSQPDSPLKRLTVAVVDATRLNAIDALGAARQASGAVLTSRAVAAAGRVAPGAAAVQVAASVGALLSSDASRDLEAQAEAHFVGLQRLLGDGKTGDVDAGIALIAQIAGELVAMQQRLATGQGIREVPAALTAARINADRFAAPVGNAIRGLVAMAAQEASGGVKREVQSSMGGASALCRRAVPGRYPFSRASMQDTGLQDFVNVFKAGGDLAAFFDASLARFVDKSGPLWQFKALSSATPPVSRATLLQFQHAEAIRAAFLGGGSTPQVQADISAISADAEVLIEYDGAQHRLRAGSTGIRLSWPARPGARLSIGGAPVANVEGSWALFRLIDRGSLDPSSRDDRLRVSYTSPTGARAVLEIATGSAAFNPFRLRELTAFSCPQE